MEEGKLNVMEIVENIGMEDESDRLVFHGGKWVHASEFSSEIEIVVDSLTASEREMCLKYIYKQSSTITQKLSTFLKKYEGMHGEIASVITSKSAKVVSNVNVDLEYTCNVVTKSFGTVSSISGAINQLYSYAYECKDNGNPDFEGAAVQLASGFYKPDDDGTKPERFSKAKEIRSYHPTRNTMIDYVAMVKDATTPEGVVNRMCDAYKEFKPQLKRQFLRDIVKATPTRLAKKESKLKVAMIGKAKPRTVLFKAPVVRYDIQKAEFSAGVSAISKLSTGLGSTKYGMGRMTECHYDGIMGLRGSTRSKHEYITDFIPAKVDIVFVNTRNDHIASAIFRQQRDFLGDDAKVVVIYSTQSAQQTKLREVLKVEEGKIVGILSSGIIGLPQLMWRDVAENVSSYYVSFKKISSGKGTDSELVSTSRQERERVISPIVGRFDYYAYYAFVGSMLDDDQVALSCRGRTGDVIFTNCKGVKLYSTKEAMTAVYNMCAHANLFPWLNSCYLYEQKGKRYYECRALKSQYSFKRVGAADNAIVDFGEEFASTGDINALALDIVGDTSASEVRERAVPVEKKHEKKEDVDDDVADMLSDLADEDDEEVGKD